MRKLSFLAYPLSLFLLMLMVASPVSAGTTQATVTPAPTITVTAPAGYVPTVQNTGNIVGTCPLGVPVGWGTVTPDALWAAVCSACMPTDVYNTAMPTVTVTGTPPTATVTSTATPGGCPEGLLPGISEGVSNNLALQTTSNTYFDCGLSTASVVYCTYSIQGYYDQDFGAAWYGGRLRLIVPHDSDVYYTWTESVAHHAGPECLTLGSVVRYYPNTWDCAGTLSHTSDSASNDTGTFTGSFHVGSSCDDVSLTGDIICYITISDHQVGSLDWSRTFDLGGTITFALTSSCRDGFAPMTPTPVPVLDYCASVNNSANGGSGNDNPDIFGWSGVSYGTSLCIDIGNWSLTGSLPSWITGSLSIPDVPWLAHLCLANVDIGTVHVWGVAVSLMLITYVLGIAFILWVILS